HTHPAISLSFSYVVGIASIEHNLAAQFEAATSAEHFGEVALFTTGVSLVTRFLGSRGFLGQILSQGLGSYLSSQGVGEIQSAVSIVAYLIEIQKVSSLNE